VAIFTRMEDTATAEISRSQVWQWLHNDIVLADTAQVVSREMGESIDEDIATLPGQQGDYAQARATFVDVAIADDFAEFLTLSANERMPGPRAGAGVEPGPCWARDRSSHRSRDF